MLQLNKYHIGMLIVFLYFMNLLRDTDTFSKKLMNLLHYRSNFSVLIDLHIHTAT